MKNEKCGIYGIECRATGKLYVGSSCRIYRRWWQHRRNLRRGVHTGVYLQNSWTKHGEAAFQFSILEECSRDALAEREQHYIDALKPALNSMPIVFPRKAPSPEMKAKIAAAAKARAAARTHCPHGHSYDAANTYYGKKGEKICRVCNKERARAIIAAESPEERDKRMARMKQRYDRDGDKLRAQMATYNAAHREEKRAYDKGRRAITRQQKRERFAKMTPEQREAMNRLKRESWARRARP